MVRNSFFQIFGDNLRWGDNWGRGGWGGIMGGRADGEKQFFPDLGGSFPPWGIIGQLGKQFSRGDNGDQGGW